jgi:hypothetical protein
MRILLEEHVVERTTAWQRSAARPTVKMESMNSIAGDVPSGRWVRGTV